MRVILDTNVFLAALISPYGAPEQIYRAWRKGRFELVTSEHQLDELRRASRYPKLAAILPAHRVGTLINNLHRAVVLQKLQALPDGLQADDPDDDFLLAMALSTETDYLVTGDRKAGLLQLGHIGRAQIVPPAQFCEQALRH